MRRSSCPRDSPSSPANRRAAATALAYLAVEERDLAGALRQATELEEIEKSEWPVSRVIAGLVALEQGDVALALDLVRTCVAETHALGMEGALSYDLDALAASLAATGDAEGHRC